MPSLVDTDPFHGAGRWLGGGVKDSGKGWRTRHPRQEDSKAYNFGTEELSALLAIMAVWDAALDTGDRCLHDAVKQDVIAANVSAKVVWDAAEDAGRDQVARCAAARGNKQDAGEGSGQANQTNSSRRREEFKTRHTQGCWHFD